MTEELPFSVPERHEAAVRTLALAKTVLQNISVPFWLSHGTLLGAIRDHDFIAHDSDIDLGIWDADCDHELVAREFEASGFRSAQELGSVGLGHQMAFWSPFGVYIDLFFYVREADSCWMALWVEGKAKRMVFPPIVEFAPIQFCGDDYLVPVNYEELLCANYGDWSKKVAPVERGGEWRWWDSPRNLQ